MSGKEQDQEERVSCCTNPIKSHEFEMSRRFDRYADRTRPRLSSYTGLSRPSHRIYNFETTQNENSWRIGEKEKLVNKENLENQSSLIFFCTASEMYDVKAHFQIGHKKEKSITNSRCQYCDCLNRKQHRKWQTTCLIFFVCLEHQIFCIVTTEENSVMKVGSRLVSNQISPSANPCILKARVPLNEQIMMFVKAL
nr:unnamed protein product [Callosobruchus analis]